MSNEDKIRADFERWVKEDCEDEIYADIDTWKACAEYYEKKLAELPKSVITHDEWYNLCNQLEAAQLHIKELREALDAIGNRNSNHSAFTNSSKHSLQEIYEEIAAESLAKQPDTRALDKALLEADIKVLSFAYVSKDFAEVHSMLVTRGEKLAELNKE